MKHEITAIALGAVLAQLRARRGYTLTAVSKLAGMGRSYLWEIEQGQTNVTVGLLVKIANVYQVEPSEIIFMAEQEMGQEGGRGER